MLIAERSANVQHGGARATGSRRSTVALALVVALLVGAFAGRFVFLGSGGESVATGGPSGSLDAARSSVEANPEDPAALAGLAAAALAEARRTSDPTFYAQADDAIVRAERVAPTDLRVLVTGGLLALARHEFPRALALAEQARAVAPLAVDPLGVQVDALVELGRYDEATLLAEEMVTRRPNVSSLPRLSYVLELRGRPDDALEAMQQAVAAGGDRGSEAAYVLALLGDLHLQVGRLDAADAAYTRSLAAERNQPQAHLGRARVLVDRGDLPAAAAVLRALTDRVPLPGAVALYGDVLAAMGDTTSAADQRALVRAIEELNRTQGGVAVDLELARFEADHARLPDGDVDRAIALAEAARSARPTIYADDILAWALRQAGRPAEALVHAQAATRLGTADATLWWHRAAIEADLGRVEDARAHLTRAFKISPHPALVDRAEATALAARLAVSA